MDYGNNVDAEGNALAPKPNADSSDYPSALPYYLPFGGPSKDRNLARKSRKVANRRARRASARAFANTAAADISESLSSTVSAVLKNSDYPTFMVVADDEDACADSGATDVMLNDFAHSCHFDV